MEPMKTNFFSGDVISGGGFVKNTWFII